MGQVLQIRAIITNWSITYHINLDGKQSEGTYRVSLFIHRNTAVFFDSCGIEYIPQGLLNKIKDKWITHNIFRIQSNDSIRCGFYDIPFIEYLIAEKTWLDYTNLFSPNGYKNNYKTIYKYFKHAYAKRKRKLWL